MNLPVGVKRLAGSLFRIPLSCITTADGGCNPKAQKFEFFNPRWTEVDGKKAGAGFSPVEMEMLREDIREHGLNQVLLCRFTPYMPEGQRDNPKSIQLVDGERRFRSVSYLVKNKVPCWDRETHTFVPADVLYQSIDCRVSWMTDDEAMSVALLGNETSEHISTGAYISLVKHLRHVGKSDKEILAILKKSPDWLVKTEHLLGLDADTFRALCEDKINRKVANTLLGETDLNKRANMLERALAATSERIALLQETVREAEIDHELAEAEQAVLKEFGAPQDAVNAAVARVEKTKARVRNARSGLARPRTAISSGKDMEAAGVADSRKPLTGPKIKKYMYDPIIAMIDAKGNDPETKEPLDIDLDDARLVKSVLDALHEGADDQPETLMLRLLQTHKRRKERRTAAATK